MYKLFFKRFIDIVASLICLLILFPFLVIITFILFFQNKGEPFFIQSRPGFKERSFRIVKFKTMTDEKDKDGNLLPDNKRITAFGNLIRKFSIDELPQLFNVLIGDMSLVGPRPLLFKYLPLYNEAQRRRHLVRPGITGWAQVNGRNAISWTEKFRYDIHYVDACSFQMDFRILTMTVLKVFKREGVNQSKERPMTPFLGNES